MMHLDYKKVIVLVISFAFILAVVLGNAFILKNKKNTQNELNVYDNVVANIYINLNGVSQETINSGSKDIKYKDNNFKLMIDDKIILEDKITIKGRGNTTWKYQKKPYQVSFDEKIDLLDLGSSNKYVLLADYLDESLLRNHISFFIADMFNMQYSMKGKHVNLYINDEYQGLYYLTNKVSISEGSVNLEDADAILVELDNMYFEKDEYMVSKTYKDHIVFKDFKNDDNKDVISKSFMNRYNEFEIALKNKDWNIIQELIDVDSFAKYYLVNLISNNKDAYKTSFFMYQDCKESKIYAGPVWDFDVSFHDLNDNKLDGENDFDENSSIIVELLKMDEFKKIVIENWYQYYDGKIDIVLNEADNEYNLIKEYGVLNAKKWYSNVNYDKSYNRLRKILSNSYDVAYSRVNDLK